MKKFFYDIHVYNLLDDYAEILDWLFNDLKFDKFTKSDKSKFTKMITTFLRNNNINFAFDLRLNELSECGKDSIRIQQGDSKSVLLMKKLRNGIAHGKARIKIYNGTKYIFMSDLESGYYINIPLNYLNNFYVMYLSVLGR